MLTVNLSNHDETPLHQWLLQQHQHAEQRNDTTMKTLIEFVLSKTNVDLSIKCDELDDQGLMGNADRRIRMIVTINSIELYNDIVTLSTFNTLLFKWFGIYEQSSG